MRPPVFNAALLGFLAGLGLCQCLDRQALDSADAQIRAAFSAVAQARQRIEQLQNCPARGTTVWIAHPGEPHHD